MPSIRKRIGYLPSVNIQEIITNIAKTKNLSQSKVVGILVEEALTARGVFDFENTNDLIRSSRYQKETQTNISSFKFSEVDELISDKGITYNTNKYRKISEDVLSEDRENSTEELFEKFKQFILFQKMIDKNNK